MQRFNAAPKNFEPTEEEVDAVLQDVFTAMDQAEQAKAEQAEQAEQETPLERAVSRGFVDRDGRITDEGRSEKWRKERQLETQLDEMRTAKRELDDKRQRVERTEAILSMYDEAESKDDEAKAWKPTPEEIERWPSLALCHGCGHWYDAKMVSCTCWKGTSQKPRKITEAEFTLIVDRLSKLRQRD